MTTDRDMLDELFAEARDAETPGEALVARVLADAARVQGETPLSDMAPVRGGGGGWLSGIGSWLGAGGLVAATAAGLLIGVTAPDTVDSALGGRLTDLGLVAQDDLVPTLSYLLPGEGG